MSPAIHMQHVNHSSAWYGRELVSDTSWLVHLTPQDFAEIDDAITNVAARGLSLDRIGCGDFPLPTLGPRLLMHLEQIRDGRGFVVLRGLPTIRYSDAEVGLIFWGIGTYLGAPVTQNPRGDLLGHVYDHGRNYGDIDVRGYETKAHLPFHTDGCDLVGLLCLRRAKAGGLSSIVSSVTIHNEILKQHPEYLRPLYTGFHYIKREAALSEAPITPYRLPVFGARDGFVSCRLIRNQIDAACVKSGMPLDPLEKAALDYLDSLAQDPAIHLDMDLQPGDMQLCNNYTILHSRTGFEDHPEPERRRHMIRLWLTFGQRRPLADRFPAHDGYGRNQIAEAAALQDASGS